jgi:hypothetical protein
MKPSDRKPGTAPRDDSAESLPYPRSDIADPPITVDEAWIAETSTCRWHNGRIKTDPLETDVDGKVFFCPIGRQYWRYTKKDNAFFRPLPGPRMA